MFTHSRSIKHGLAPLAVGSQDAAELISISVRHLWSLTKKNQVPHVRLGKRIIYPVEALNQWLVELAMKSLQPAQDV